MFGTDPDSIRHAFEVIDTDGSGHLSVSEFRETLSRLGMGLTEQQLNVISKAFDINKDGDIEFEELVHTIETNRKQIQNLDFYDHWHAAITHYYI